MVSPVDLVVRVELETGAAFRFEARKGRIVLMSKDSSGRSVIAHLTPEDWEELKLAGDRAVELLREML